MRWIKDLNFSINQGTVSRQMLHSRCYCTWELKVLWQLNCNVQVTHIFVFFELLDLYWIQNDFNINHITGYEHITNENPWSSTPYICVLPLLWRWLDCHTSKIFWKTSKRKTPRKEQGLRIAITMEASSWMAGGKRLSKSGGSDLISDCPERNLIGMQPAPICLKFHRWRICLEFHFGCTWNPWEREATKRRGGGMRDCLGSQMATIWSTSISIL